MFAGMRPHQCTKCQKRYRFSSNLKVHLRTHSGERPFKCPVCSKTFNESSILKRHMLIHSGTKPHSCDQCSSKFRHSGTLKSHKSLLHKNKQHLPSKEELKHNIDGEDDMSASIENTSTRRWKEKGPRISAVKNPHITPSDNSSSEGEILDLTMSNHDKDRHNSLTPTKKDL